MDVLQVLQHYPAKIPHFFENLQILAFYAILFITPLVFCNPLLERPNLDFRELRYDRPQLPSMA